MKLTVLSVVLSTLTYAADVSSLVTQIQTYEHGKNASAVREFETLVLKSTGPDAARIEKTIITELPETKTLAGKDALCRALGMIGSDASVPLLTRMLMDADTGEMARHALEKIPGRGATDALHRALKNGPDPLKVGVVVSLGRRKDSGSVRMLTPLLGSADSALVNAAATALGAFGDRQSLDALLSAEPGAAVTDSLLAIAERSPGPSALSIYKRLAAATYPEPVRIAALRGSARIDSQLARALLVEALTSTSPRLQATAVAELTSIEGAGFGKRINELPPRAQVQAITALADTGKQDILPVLEQHLTSGADSVRVASLRGIGKLGSAKHISVLATRAASATGDEQAAARAALGAIRGKEADSAVLTAITTTDPKVKIELIRAAGERGISTAPDILLKTASHENRAVRLESIRALRETAGSADISALVSLLVKTANETDRKEYERTVAAAIRRSKDAPISELVAAYKTATDTDLQVSLLGVMGTVGSSEALPIIRQALTSSNADVQRAAINTLASWPSPEPAKDLLTLAQSAPNAVHQILGLRGYVRLVQLPSDRAPAETAKMLSAGMAAAKRPEEKKIVIAAAQRVITPESVDLVKATLDDPAVAPEAKAAITTLERGLMYRKN